MSFLISAAILGRLDDPCANVRELAVECLPKIEADRSDETFSESNDSHLAETIILRLALYLDDPYIKIRPILLGSHSFYSIHLKEITFTKLKKNFTFFHFR